jgi:hypothetical protein
MPMRYDEPDGSQMRSPPSTNASWRGSWPLSYTRAGIRKLRSALHRKRSPEGSGELEPGQELLEPTSGNTGK